MLNDVEFITSKLGKLDGFGDTGEYLEKIIESKGKGVKSEAKATNKEVSDTKDEGKTGEKAPAEDAARDD